MSTVNGELTTFIDPELTGPVDERINNATGLGDIDEMLGAMNEKSTETVAAILFESTCNADCPFCFFVSGRASSMPITPEVVEKARAIIANLDLEDVELALYPREITTALPLLPLYKELGINRALTNAKLLSEQRFIDALVENGITRISVSVEGPREVFKKMTDSSDEDFDRVMQGIDSAVAAGIEVSTFTALSRVNLDTLEETLELLNSKGVTSATLIKQIPAGLAQSLPPENFLDREDIKRVIRIVDIARKEYPEMKILLAKFGPNFCKSGIYRYLAGGGKRPNTKYYCPRINNKFLGILINTGEINTCFQSIGDRDSVVGYLDEDNQMVIERVDITDEELSENLREPCASCGFKKICLGGCATQRETEAILREEEEPRYAGFKDCLTQILGKEVKSNA